LAGAAATSRLREAVGTVPIRLDVSSGSSGPGLISGTVTVRSLAPGPLGRVKVEPLWAPGLGEYEPRSWWVRDLQAGESRRLTFTVQQTERFVRERYRDEAVDERMLAFRARVWQAPQWPRGAHAFNYWKAVVPVTALPDGAQP
jgi:hypothetical protein